MRKLHSQVPESFLYRAATEKRGLRTARVTAGVPGGVPRIDPDRQVDTPLAAALYKHIADLEDYPCLGGTNNDSMRGTAVTMYVEHMHVGTDTVFMGSRDTATVHTQVLTAILQRHLELFSNNYIVQTLHPSRFKGMSIGVKLITGQAAWQTYVQKLRLVGKKECTGDRVPSRNKRTAIVQTIQQCIELVAKVKYDAIKIPGVLMRSIIHFHV